VKYSIRAYRSFHWCSLMLDILKTWYGTIFRIDDSGMRWWWWWRYSRVCWSIRAAIPLFERLTLLLLNIFPRREVTTCCPAMTYWPDGSIALIGWYSVTVTWWPSRCGNCRYFGTLLQSLPSIDGKGIMAFIAWWKISDWPGSVMAIMRMVQRNAVTRPQAAEDTWWLGRKLTAWSVEETRQ